MLKIYSAPGMLDWHMSVRVGNASVRFHFKDGYLGPVNVTPAKYATADPVLQKILEESRQYRRGQITMQPAPTITRKRKPQPIDHR